MMRTSRLRPILALAGAAFLLAACAREQDAPGAKPAPPASAPPAAAPAPPIAAGRRLEPVDEASKDPSFATFREELLAAVERRDARYVLGVLDPKIRNSFGDGGGVEEFQEMWEPERADSELWPELRKILTHGGAFRDGMFCAPYVFTSFPEDLDAFEYGAVLEDDAVLRSRPDASAPPVATLSYHVVRIASEGSGGVEHPEWYKVATTEGAEGYLPVPAVGSPVDYRACFEKRDGAWRMVLLVAGD